MKKSYSSDTRSVTGEYSLMLGKLRQFERCQQRKMSIMLDDFAGWFSTSPNFLDKLSDRLQPLRELTKKVTVFTWSEKCERAFCEIKNLIATTPVLRFYDPNKTLEVQVDSSKDGLGVCLMQEGQPVEFASRTLTGTEQR